MCILYNKYITTSILQGYFRKGEIEFATCHYSDAINSYNQALQYKPDDCDIENAITRTNGEWRKDCRGLLILFYLRSFLKKEPFSADDQVPWLGAGIGIVLGVVIVIGDFIFTNKPTLTVSL